MKQFSYIIKRVLQMIPVLFLVTILIFIMIRLIPGNPAEIMLGDKATPELVAALEKRMGLDQSMPEQYLIFLKQIVTLDLGNSIHYVVPVSELLGQRVVVTVSLVAMTSLFVVLISFPFGLTAGSHEGSGRDNVVKVGSLLSISLPQFWVGSLLLLLFALKLHWLPVAGWGETVPDHLRALILPSITGALSTCGLVTRNLRSNVIAVAKSDYVDFARSKGLSENIVQSKHITRNALVSTVTLLALRIANMLGGSIVIETVFALPGVGQLLVNSIFSRDYAVVQSVVMVFAFIVLVVNLITDVSYSLLDPRVKLE